MPATPGRLVVKCTHCGTKEVGQRPPCSPDVEGGRVAVADVLAGRGFGDAGEGEVVFDEAFGEGLTPTPASL
jgi:hypothetical protein